MSEAQIQAIKDVIKMTPRLNTECLNSIKILMEKAIDSELLRLEPTVILENMDITEKVMYLDYLTESKDTKEKELKNAVSFEEILNLLSSYQNHEINLILDAGEVIDSRTANNTFDSYKRTLSDNIKLLCTFENITICLTSFPEDLRVESGEDMTYKRYDILIFKKLIEEFKDSELNEKLQYSDYGVTKFTETDLDFSKMKYGILPKVKYTTNTDYIIKKAEKDRRNNIFTRSIIDITKEIVNSKYFFGKEFSYGDKCIYEKAYSANVKPGNPQQWVTYCANHHLAVVMEQLSNLSGS